MHGEWEINHCSIATYCFHIQGRVWTIKGGNIVRRICHYYTVLSFWIRKRIRDDKEFNIIMYMVAVSIIPNIAIYLNNFELFNQTNALGTNVLW